MRNAFIETFTKILESDENNYLITGDAGFGVFDSIQKIYPDNFLNLGIAEQNTMSFAAGMGLTGRKVWVYNIIPFLLYRCYEQVRNDVCYQKVPLVLIGIGSGLSYAPQGMTHYSVEDLGICQTLPNLEVISPCDPLEVIVAVEYAARAQNPVYIRIAKKGEPNLHNIYTKYMDIRIPQTLVEGEDAAIVFHGPIGIEASNARKELEKSDIYPALISVPMVQPLNTLYLKDMLKNYKQVICIEEHYTNCGLASQMQKMCCQPWKLITLGVEDHFIHEVKNTDEMRKHFGISSNDLVETIREWY